nr:hypothetical protein [Nocardioides albidus]
MAVHPGVYVVHTGPLTWRQRAWAAVLFHQPAALDGWSAIRAHEGPGRHGFDGRGPIEVVVPHASTPVRVDGVTVRRSRRFAEIAHTGLTPPRLRYDDAIIALADRTGDELQAVAILADACGSRRTTATRLQARLAETPRLRRRTWLSGVLADVAEGTCSVLEHAYLTKVERPHGLPRGDRQSPDRGADGRRIYRDVVYRGHRPPWVQHVELDGHLFHESAGARDRDLERDLDAAVGLADTVRLGYGQVVGRPCSTAAKLGLLLQRRGWRGTPRMCPACADRG